MSNKIVLGIIIVLIFIGALLLLINRPKLANPIQTNTNQQGNTTNTNNGTNTTQTTDYGNVVTIQVTKEGYNPQNVTINAGTKVVWTNVSEGVVSVHTEDHPTHLLYPPLNLGEFQDGSSVQLIFDKAGTYKYHDHLNPQFKGTVTVQ